MRRIILIASFLMCSCSDSSISIVEEQCEIRSPNDALPNTFEQIALGMSYSEVIEILGEPDHMPTAGIYYHTTGGECSTNGGPRAACGFVVEYFTRVYAANKIRTDLPEDNDDYRLQSCSWGGIGE